MTLDLDVAIDHPGWNAKIPALESLAERVIGACLDLCPLDTEASTEVSLLFTDDRKIRALNAAWREQDRPTNVLSFPAPIVPGAPLRALGDIILAYETVEREADAENKTFENHTIHLIAHGFLHLLGFDHESEQEADEMEARERAALALLGAPDPYEAPVGER